MTMRDPDKIADIKARMEQMAEGMEDSMRELEADLRGALGTPTLIDLPGDRKMIALDDVPVLVSLKLAERPDGNEVAAAYEIELVPGMPGVVDEPQFLSMN